jgi:hypothetical protein
MKNHILLLFFMSQMMITGTNLTQAQQPDSISVKLALSQTRGMAQLLGLNDSLTQIVYQLNLKYQLKTDSLRASSLLPEERKLMHGNIFRMKNEELINILPSEKYNKFIISIGKGGETQP